MDEEIIQRIIYIILGIVLFIIFSSKKKPQTKQATEPKTNTETEQEQREIFKPVETLKTDNKSAVQTRLNKLETITEDEIFEDETTVDRRVISKNKTKILIEATNEQGFTFTTEELKKAVILSEIIQPKHF